MKHAKENVVEANETNAVTVLAPNVLENERMRMIFLIPENELGDSLGFDSGTVIAEIIDKRPDGTCKNYEISSYGDVNVDFDRRNYRNASEMPRELRDQLWMVSQKAEEWEAAGRLNIENHNWFSIYDVSNVTDDIDIDIDCFDTYQTVFEKTEPYIRWFDGETDSKTTE